MTRIISKRTRSEAILICAIAASTPRPPGFGFNANLDSCQIAQWLGQDEGEPVDLAYEARRRTSGGGDRTQETDAEAECLLREGWTP